jgi:isopentenyl-diphosphate Delta-isomerase
MTEKIYPNITAVNEHDEVMGYFQLFDAIAKGHIRRIVAVFVFDEEGRLLIQRRAANVLSPNLLDFSAAGHVNEGDDYVSSAQSELFEELGIQDVHLELVQPPFSTPGYFNGVFKGVITKETIITANLEEVAKVFWVTLPELEEMVARHPQQFTEPFLTVWPQVRDKITS